MKTRLLNCLICSVSVVSFWSISVIARAEEPAASYIASYYEQILREKRIEPTAAGLLRYFKYTGGKMIDGCQPLVNGNVLLADLGGQVIEVTRDKKVVWQYSCSSPCDCFRLPNGNTLITGHIQFIEVTPDKKVLWTKPGYGYGSARR